MMKAEAVDRAHVLLGLFPSHPVSIFIASQTFLRQGMIEEAATTLEKGLRAFTSAGYPIALGFLALARNRQGRTADAERIRADLDELSTHQYVPFLPRAFASEGCGDMDRAYQLLDQAVEEREPLAVPVLADRRADLLTDPRYQALLRKMNLA